MTATTDLRAALRDAANALASEAANKRATIHAAVFGDGIPSRYDAIAARCRALADAPPTVAELLPMVDATHRLEWTDADDDERIAQLEGTVIKSYFRSPGKGADAWSPIGLLASDTTRPAKLVEVSP